MHLPSITASYHVGAEASPTPRVGAGLREPPRACGSLLIRRSRRGQRREKGLVRCLAASAREALRVRRPCKFLFFSSRAPSTPVRIPCALQRAIVNNNANTMARPPARGAPSAEATERLTENGVQEMGALHHGRQKEQ
jgi:hypothetical protein